MRTPSIELEVFLFGRPPLRFRGAAFRFGARKDALTLLVYLLIHRAQATSRDTAAFALWADLPPTEARTRLRANLHALLATGLPPRPDGPWIIADRRALQWNPQAAIRLDIEDFEHFLEQPGRTAEAVELYVGELADGLDDDWLLAPRDRLREKQQAAVLQLVDECHKSDDVRQAIHYVQVLLKLDPFREDAIRTLMELRYEVGDRAGAIHVYHAFVQRIRSELDAEPMAETKAVYERIASAQHLAERRTAGPMAASFLRAQHNLPSPLTSFLDRKEDVATLIRLVKQRRLITLTGPGGVGKTRLAWQTGHAVLAEFPDGVWNVELGGLTDPRLVLESLAQTLGIDNASQRTSFIALQPKSLLLILDNCEHVIDAVRNVAKDILSQCPRIGILATSREALRIFGERVFQVEPFPLPISVPISVPSIEQIRESAAVRLFFERAGDISPTFQAPKSADDWRTLASLMHHLNGIPLAIELSAARSNALSINQIEQGMTQRLDLLTSTGNPELPRHQTMRACLDWSYDLLDDAERRQFRRLAIFADGCSLKAAVAVARDQPETETVRLLQSLVDKSLVQADMSDFEPRYSMLDTLRTYAREKLSKSEEHAEIPEMHAIYFAKFVNDRDKDYARAVRMGRQSFPDAGGLMSFVTPIRREMDNVRAALEWSITNGNDPHLGAKLVSSLWRFFVAQSLFAEGERWAQAAIRGLGPSIDGFAEGPLQLVRALTLSAPYYMPAYRRDDGNNALLATERAVELLTRHQQEDEFRLSLAMGVLVMNLQIDGRSKDAQAVAQTALEFAQEQQDPIRTAIALYFQAFSVDPEDMAQRIAILKRAYEGYSEVGFAFGVAYTLLAFAEASFEHGEITNAVQSATKAQSFFQQTNDKSVLALVRGNIGKYFTSLNNLEQAQESAYDALVLAQQSAEPSSIAIALQVLAGIAVVKGDATSAARILGASDGLLGAAHRHRVLYALSHYQRLRSSITVALSERDLQSAFRLGRSWQLSEAIAAATAV